MSAAVLGQHRRVLDVSVGVVNQSARSDLGLMTPCAGWALRDLLAHMIGQNYGFAAAAEAAAAETGRAERAAFADRPVTRDPAAEYAASAEAVVRGFGTDGLLDRSVFLAEIRGGVEVPGAAAVGFHLVDYVAHSWDVAVSLGVTVEFDDDVLQTALQVADAVPAQAKSTAPGAPFAPAVHTTSERLLDRVLASLGRDPGWTRTRP